MKVNHFYRTKLNVLTLAWIKRLFLMSIRLRVKLIDLKGNPSPLIQNPLTNTGPCIVIHGYSRTHIQCNTPFNL